MKHQNLTIIGTSHIAKESIDAIETHIRKNNPQIIAIELDQDRMMGLLHPSKPKYRLKDIRLVGVKGYLFARFGAWAEEKMGESVGVSPGSEMKKAVELAHELEIPVALIDQDIAVTLRRLSSEITWKEKFRFLWDVVKGLVTRKPAAEFDLSKVPAEATIRKLVKEVKKRYPSVYKVLILERNQVMAKRLSLIMTNHPDKTTLAIIGAGHEKEILQMVKEELAKSQGLSVP